MVRRGASSLLSEQAKRFAHLGLEEVDVRARHLLGDSYSIDVPRLPSSESHIQFLIGKYALSTRLSHVASKVPTSLALPTLSKYDVLSVAVAAGVMGKSLHLNESLPPTSALTATQNCASVFLLRKVAVSRLLHQWPQRV